MPTKPKAAGTPPAAFSSSNPSQVQYVSPLGDAPSTVKDAESPVTAPVSGSTDATDSVAGQNPPTDNPVTEQTNAGAPEIHNPSAEKPAEPGTEGEAGSPPDIGQSNPASVVTSEAKVVDSLDEFRNHGAYPPEEPNPYAPAESVVVVNHVVEPATRFYRERRKTMLDVFLLKGWMAKKYNFVPELRMTRRELERRNRDPQILQRQGVIELVELTRPADSVQIHACLQKRQLPAPSE